MRFFGYHGTLDRVEIGNGNDDFVAGIHLGMRNYAATAEDQILFKSIRRAHPVHKRFDAERQVPFDVLNKVSLASNVFGNNVWVTPLENKNRSKIEKRVLASEKKAWNNKAYRRELLNWHRSNSSTNYRDDGIPGSNVGFGSFMSSVAPGFLRTFSVGKGRMMENGDLAKYSPSMVMLGSQYDTFADHVRTGLVAQFAILVATANKLSFSFLNQPVEDPETRNRLVKYLPQSSVGIPQLIIRFGYRGKKLKSQHLTPRRSVRKCTFVHTANGYERLARNINPASTTTKTKTKRRFGLFHRHNAAANTTATNSSTSTTSNLESKAPPIGAGTTIGHQPLLGGISSGVSAAPGHSI